MSHINLIPGEQGIRLSTLSPKYLHTNSTSHTWPFSAIAELIDNAYDPDVDASQLWIDIKRYGTRSDHCLTFTDNGEGMDSLKLHKMLSFGFCEKVAKNDHLPVGHYGNGFKSGSMRLGKDAIVFTKQQDSRSVGLLSQTYLEEIKAQTILVPIVSWDSNGDMVERADGDKALRDILKYSLFKTEAELQEQFNNIPSESGTRIVISGMRKTQDGNPEFDFRSDIHDIRIPDDVESESNKYRRQERQNHIPESDYSLRAYCSILYLRPRMQIILRGKKVRTTVIAKSLSKTEVDTYKPQGTSKPIKVTFGFSQNKNHYGIMMYHRNRLIKPYVRVGYQLRANNFGVGVIGVIQCDYLKPTHNKQDFDYTKAYRSSMSALGSKLNDYWNEKKGKAQTNSNALIPEPKEVESVPDQLWVQCDNPECLKWRKLPASVKSEDLPEKWYCYDHPEKQWRSCDVPEELEEEKEEAVQPYVKKQKKRLEKELEEKKRREKEAKAVKELELQVKEKEIQKKEAELQKLTKAVEAKSKQQKEALQQQKGKAVKTEAQSPQKLQVRVVAPPIPRQQTAQVQKKYIIHQANGQQVVLTPVSSQPAQNALTQVATNVKMTPVVSPVNQTVKAIAAPTNTQNAQQPGLRVVKVVTHGSPVLANTKPVLVTASAATQGAPMKVEPLVVPKVGGPTVTKVEESHVPKVGGPPVMLKVNSHAAAKHVANLPTMVPVTAIVVDPSPKVVSVQSLAAPEQNYSLSDVVQQAKPIEAKPQSDYKPLESLIEVNRHAAESSISPVSAVIPDNSTSSSSMTSPTLGRKDVTVNDRFRYIAPSGKTPISSHSTTNTPGPQGETLPQVKLETPTPLDVAETGQVKTEPQQSTPSPVSKLKRPHDDDAEADETPRKRNADSAVIVIDPPSPPKDTYTDNNPDGTDIAVSKTEANTSTIKVDTNDMDDGNSQKQKTIANVDKNIIPIIDISIVEAVKKMSPQQQFKALLSRTQQLYELRGNVCKLLRVLVPELEVDDRKENFEDQTVDELLQQVLEQAETSESESNT